MRIPRWLVSFVFPMLALLAGPLMAVAWLFFNAPADWTTYERLEGFWGVLVVGLLAGIVGMVVAIMLSQRD